jgi:hypothetical protein
MCEFHEPSVPDCSLKCQNGGSCRYGTKQEDHALTLNEPDGSVLAQNISIVHEGHMNCECPDGFRGAKCEVEEKVCGDIKCLHGSTCVTVENKDTGEANHHCGCNLINVNKLQNGEDLQYAG